jgi:hypothetical protein
MDRQPVVREPVVPLHLGVRTTSAKVCRPTVAHGSIPAIRTDPSRTSEDVRAPARRVPCRSASLCRRCRDGFDRPPRPVVANASVSPRWIDNLSYENRSSRRTEASGHRRQRLADLRSHMGRSMQSGRNRRVRRRTCERPRVAGSRDRSAAPALVGRQAFADAVGMGWIDRHVQLSRTRPSALDGSTACRAETDRPVATKRPDIVGKGLPPTVAGGVTPRCGRGSRAAAGPGATASAR